MEKLAIPRRVDEQEINWNPRRHEREANGYTPKMFGKRRLQFFFNS